MNAAGHAQLKAAIAVLRAPALRFQQNCLAERMEDVETGMSQLNVLCSDAAELLDTLDNGRADEATSSSAENNRG